MVKIYKRTKISKEPIIHLEFMFVKEENVRRLEENGKIKLEDDSEYEFFNEVPEGYFPESYPRTSHFYTLSEKELKRVLYDRETKLREVRESIDKEDD